jgi:nucleoid DNA-binding protein
MTKKDMARAIAQEMSIPQAQAAAIVQRIFDGSTETLLSEGRIELRNFGVFDVWERKARRARNPRTGEAVDVPGKLVVTFKPGREMEERVRRWKTVPGRDGEAAGNRPLLSPDCPGSFRGGQVSCPRTPGERPGNPPRNARTCGRSCRRPRSRPARQRRNDSPP